MKKIAFGPEKNVPSWNWVGFDTGRELSKYYDVSYFKNMSEPPKVDCIIVIKEQAPTKFIERALNNKTKILYCPIDHFLDIAHVQRERTNLRMYTGLISHCERLSGVLKTYNKKIHFVDHNNKFALPANEMVPWREDGYVIWIGGCQYVSYLCNWIRKHPIRHPVKILTDFENDRARFAANQLATELGISLKINKKSKSIDGHECISWSERVQYELMKNAKAAIDIKCTVDFNQVHKPPTKAQKYIASGLPFSINSGSYVGEYFANRGFNIPTPLSQDRWFSKKYWEQTRDFGKKLRKWTSIEAVGERYKEIIESCF